MEKLRKITNEYDLYKIYNTEQECEKLFSSFLWKNGVVCSNCNCCNTNQSLIKIISNKTTGVFKCSQCEKMFTSPTNWLLAESKIDYSKWLIAIYKFAVETKATSSISLAQSIGVTQATTWKMFLRIARLAEFTAKNIMLVGQIELDELYLKGNERNRHKIQHSIYSKGVIGESIPMLGIYGHIKQNEKEIPQIVLRHLKMRGKCSVSSKDVKPFLDEYVSNDTTNIFFTDASKIYTAKDLFNNRKHESVIHWVKSKETKKAKEDLVFYSERFVRILPNGTKVTSNHVENIFSTFSRYIAGTHNAVTRKHVQKYADLFCFRRNTNYLKMGVGEKLYYLLTNLDAVPYKPLNAIVQPDVETGRISKKDRIERLIYKHLEKQLWACPLKILNYRNIFLWIYESSLLESLNGGALLEYAIEYNEFTDYLEEYLQVINSKLQDSKNGKFYKALLDEYHEISSEPNKQKRIAEARRRVKHGIKIYDERCEKKAKLKRQKNIKNRCPNE